MATASFSSQRLSLRVRIASPYTVPMVRRYDPYAQFHFNDKEARMSYFLKTTPPEAARGRLKVTYATLESMFMVVPKVFVAQSIRPDLLEPIVTYVKRLMIDDHALPRSTKELIAAYVSKLNACAY
jgi:hypothetical protein